MFLTDSFTEIEHLFEHEARKNDRISKGKARGTTTNTRILNNYLDNIYSKLLNYHKQLLEENKIISPNVIKARYLGKDDTRKSLIELILY